jgi:hypothetical protein
MNPMSTSKELCPVPFDQQPLNEYKHLGKLTIFAWSVMRYQDFFKKLIVLFFTINVSLCILEVLSSSLMKSPILTMGINVILTTFLLEVILVRLYLGWSYVLKRLLSATLFYEESGWYDGQIWIKSVDTLMQDRLIGMYQVNPILDRTKKILVVTSLSCCAELTVLHFIF